jgi:hypothetical protein
LTQSPGNGNDTYVKELADTSESFIDTSGHKEISVQIDTSGNSPLIHSDENSDQVYGDSNTEELLSDSQAIMENGLSDKNLSVDNVQNETKNRVPDNTFKPDVKILSTTGNRAEVSYNPFDFGNRIMMSICVHHLYYNEKIPKSEIVQSFIDHYGYPPVTIEGKPKSTESGMLVGYGFKYMRRFHQSGIFIRPQLQFLIGLGNRYDGSTQGELIDNETADGVGVKFTPVDTTKNNYFFNTELNVGYSSLNKYLPVAIYSGLRFCFWNRDMMSNQIISNYEHYFWWNLPLGVMVYKTVGRGWVLGFDATVDFMFSGRMKAVIESNYDDQGIEFPKVTLGNRCGYRFELTADGMVNERFSIQVSPYLNVYGFGKSNVEYASFTGNGFDSFQEKLPFHEPESATFVTGLNLTFTILASRK